MLFSEAILQDPKTRQAQTSALVYVVMAAIFITCLLVANLTGSLLFSFEAPWGGEVLLSAGIIPFPVTFLLTDLLNEYYGKNGARFVTLLGFAMSILTYILLLVGENLPVNSHSPFSESQFAHFSQLYTGMFIASLTAYLVGQFLDIQVFHLFRSVTKHRMIWLRATGSTVISQIFDSIIVTFIAFWGTQSLETLWSLAMGNYCWKFIVAVMITPLLYLGHSILARFIRAEEREVEANEYADATESLG
jgi:uncharacterized integral membrane protein (TIGR00697 family)